MKLYYFPMKGQKAHRVVGASGKEKSDRSAYFFLKNKDDPNYKKKYGKKYSEKQLMFLSGEIPWETTPINQITTLIRKAEVMGDSENYEKARRLPTVIDQPKTMKPHNTGKRNIVPFQYCVVFLYVSFCCLGR